MAKTGYHRADRVADQIRMEVADILMRKIKDPRVQSVTVTDVKLTSDLFFTQVYSYKIMSNVSNLAHVCSIIILKCRQLQGASPPDPRLRALSLDPTN